MKKRTMLCFVCMGMMLLPACSNNPEDSVNSAGTQTQEETDQAAGSDASQADAGSGEAAMDEEYPSEDAGPVQEESRLGYTMMYDPTVFTLEGTGEDRDVYTYDTSETLDGQVYFAVQVCRRADSS